MRELQKNYSSKLQKLYSTFTYPCSIKLSGKNLVHKNILFSNSNIKEMRLSNYLLEISWYVYVILTSKSNRNRNNEKIEMVGSKIAK